MLGNREQEVELQRLIHRDARGGRLGDLYETEYGG